MEKQPEMRLAKQEDLKELKEIWKFCFGDEDSFIDFYFESRDWMKETAVLAQNGRIASMLTMIPVNIVGRDKKNHRASMLYAIATHPDFRKKGYAGRLIEFSNEYLLARKVSMTLLVPAGEDLFRFYRNLGYRDGFFVREAVLRRGEIETLAAGVPLEEVRTGELGLPPRLVRAAGMEPELKQAQDDGTVSAAASVTIKPVEPAEYNSIRKNQLTGRHWLDYRDEELSFEKRLARMFGTDLYSIETGGGEGCAYAERISEEEVIVKELLIPDQDMAAALKQLSELLPAEKYIVRTPTYSGGVLGGSVRPFGMLRINEKKERPVNKASSSIDTDSYLGIAYD